MEIKDFKELVRKFGEYKLRGSDEVGFDCPKCGRGRKKFHLGANLKKKVFHCFRCHYSGSWGGRTIELSAKPTFQTGSLEEKLPGYTKLRLTDEKFRRYLESRGVDIKRARQLFWGKCNKGKYVGRVIIPIFEDKEAVYFVARLIKDGGIKEISPKKEENWMPRQEVVYGLDELLQQKDIILVEGIFDAEHLKRLGYFSASLLGSSLSDVQLGKILGKHPRSITFMFDGDEGGRLGQKRAVAKCVSRYRGPIRQALLPDGKDPDALTKEEVVEVLLP